MPEVTTPDSIPSLGEVTTGSSDTEEVANHDVSRVLFPSVQNKRKWENLKARMRSVQAREIARESLLDADQGFLGSDQSMDFLDLAVDTSSTASGQVEKTQTFGSSLIRTNSDSKLSDVDARAGKRGQTATEQFHEKFARFTGPLSATQLANIFSLCDGGAGESIIWSKKDEDTNTNDDRQKKNVTIQEPEKNSYTGMSWMPRAQSLARECATLKEIIRVDSANILQLRQGLDHLKEISKEQVAQIEFLRTQLLETRNKLDFLEREKEILELRENENQGTILMLKEELDTYANGKENWFQETQEDDFINIDLEQLRFENELFAAQVVENEKALRAVKQSLNDAETENSHLKHQMDLLRTSINQAKESQSTQVEGSDVAEQLLKQVAMLSARFDQVERERKTLAREFDGKLREKDKEIESIRGMLHGDVDEHERHRIVPADSFDGEMEVQLQATATSPRQYKRKSPKKSNQPSADSSEPEQKSDCGAWRLISDCLPG